MHSSHRDRISSPGTPALWDAGYASNYPDLEFLPAAVLLTRVVSVIEPGVVCLDLGYKSVASEMQPPRVLFLNADVTEQLSHSEEHLVVKTEKPLEVGDLVYALPWHICPTVARHSHLAVVQNRLVVDQFVVSSRDRI